MKQWLPAFLVVVLALVVYLPFQSISLDDFDSYNFARALIKFDPAAGIPHPPGYVLYIWLGRITLRMTGDTRVALTALSAICAALACGSLFVIAQTLFDERTALYAVLLVWLTPLLWLNANKALSDAPGLLAQALCILFIALAMKRRMLLWAAGLCLGLAAGFRPQGVIGPAAALLVIAMQLHARPREWLATGLAVILSAFTWLLPLLAAFTWKVDALKHYLTGATNFVMSQESLFATTISTQSVTERWQELWFWGSQAVFGPVAAWLRIALFAATLAFAGIACIKWRKDSSVWLCVAWLMPQVIVHLLFLNPSLTRYMLTFLFPAAILVAVGLNSLFPRHLGLAITLVFMLVVGSATLPLAQGLHTILSPPEQLADYLAQHLARTQTLIIARQSYNALLYHLPGWEIRFADYYGDDALEQEIARRQATYVVIADPESLRPGEEYVEIETRTFTRDAQIHAKHARVDVNIYSRTEGLALRDFALPEDKTIWIGTPQDAKYLLDGWYRREDIGGISARWIGSAISATLRVLLPYDVMTMTVRAVSFAPNQIVEFLCNDQPLGSAPVPQDWAEISITLPAACVQPDQLTHISFRPALVVSPAGDGKSTDRRLLGIAVAEVRFAP